MSITYPIDLLLGFPGMSTRFELVYVQEVSPTRGGVQYSADLGPALWEADYQSRVLKPSELRLWKARLASLENGAKTFKGYDLTACYPLAYPRGSWPTGLSFGGIGSLNDIDESSYKELRIAGLPAGFVISEGDYLSFAYDGYRALHQAVASVMANGDGLTPFLEVRPAIRPTDDHQSSPQPEVDMVKPHAIMTIVPGSVSAPASLDGRGTISFSARQTLSTT